MKKFGKEQKDMVKQLGIRNSKKVITLTGKMWELYCEACKHRSPYVLPCKECLKNTEHIMIEIKKIQDKKGYVKK